MRNVLYWVYCESMCVTERGVRGSVRVCKWVWEWERVREWVDMCVYVRACVCVRARTRFFWRRQGGSKCVRFQTYFSVPRQQRLINYQWITESTQITSRRWWVSIVTKRGQKWRKMCRKNGLIAATLRPKVVNLSADDDGVSTYALCCNGHPRH